MNVDLKRVRDGSIDSAPSSSKRRALGGGASPSPVVDADDDGVEDWMRVVEAKRKEAIFRQMLDYRRSYEREQLRVNELERQRRALEANLRGVEACWAQLVTSVRDRAGRPDDVPEADLLDSHTIGSKSQSEVDGALQSRLSATIRLVAQLTGDSPANSDRDLHRRIEQFQSEASALRVSSTQLQAQIDELRQSRDALQHDLQRAEKKLDRQRMTFDKEREEWRSTREESAVTSKPVANGSGHSTPNASASEQEVKPPVLPPAEPFISPEAAQQSAELEHLAQSRLQQLEALQAETAGLHQELDKLKLSAHHPSELALRDSPFFQVYLQQLAAHASRADALQGRFEMAEQKLDQLRDSNLEFREAVLAEARTEVEALRQQMSKKDIDLARLRGQRDEMNAELLERRARETEKSRVTEGLETLCSARQERIALLSSEVRRLKGKLAARDGAEGYLAFLKGDGGIDGDYVKDLQDRLASATDQVQALKAQGEAFAAGDEAAAAAETATRAELEAARRKLAKFERVLGDNPDLADDVRYLTDKLRTESESKAKLELQVSEAEAETNALYTEIEGLSTQWERLEKTLQSKVFELKDGELRISRLSTEKAKADNKYFQAMRLKEAVEAECKTAQRSTEKQQKLLERAHEVEHSLTMQVGQQDKGLTAAKNINLDLQSQLATTTSEKRQLELRLQQSQAALAEAQQLAHTRASEAASNKAARVKLQEELDTAQRSAKKLRERQEALTSASAATNVSESELQTRAEREKLLKILRCSCCEINFKQQVITKCMHTFCKECLDSRIASRQRKCPACGLAFAKEDCQTLFWQ